jgi:hypothetical protein
VEHKIIGLKAINQIVVEMSFKAKKISPAINRRISINFRETELMAIYEVTLHETQLFQT